MRAIEKNQEKQHSKAEQLAPSRGFDSLASWLIEPENRVRGTMQDWAISLSDTRVEQISHENHALVTVSDFLSAPQDAVSAATLQKFAKITPQYPGIRAPLSAQIAHRWLTDLAPMLEEHFGKSATGWEIQAWYSLVTTPARELIPMQRFPHVDGTDPRQLAMMLYLHETDHGGTGSVLAIPCWWPGPSRPWRAFGQRGAVSW